VVELEDGDRIEAPSHAFDASTHVATLGSRSVPWHRIRRVRWPLPPMATPEDTVVTSLRVTVDDGGDGEMHEVSLERFEIADWGVWILVEDQVDLESGLVSLKRIGIPWHRLRSYERVRTGDAWNGDLPLDDRVRAMNEAK
jgi:hypothetical protein